MALKEALLEYLDNLDLPGLQILRELGISNLTSESIDLKQISHLLDEEMDQYLNENPILTVQSAIKVIQNEVYYLKSNLDNVAYERDKLRSDLNECNQRSLVLAQEIDDQHARLEKAGQIRIK